MSAHTSFVSGGVDSESVTAGRRLRAMRSIASAIFAVLLSLSLAWPALALDAGQRLPEIGLTDLSGKKIDVASLQGKVVIVDFLASWCGPCKQELPVLEKLYKKYGAEGLVVVGVSVDEELANLQGLLKQVKVSFPVVHDASKVVAGRYKPPRMPSSYVVDRKGIVRYVHGGFRKEDGAKLETEVKALLAAK
jgi:thiol-disulfide isomerase/thioredoxin